jgi:hypothetical protein
MSSEDYMSSKAFFPLVQEGQYKIESCKIIPLDNPEMYVDVTNIMHGFSVNQSIFSPFITGAVSISDAVGLVKYLPIVGNELMEISFVRPEGSSLSANSEDIPGQRYDIPETKPIRQQFRIYKLSEKRKVSDFAVAYTLHFVSRESVKDIKTKVGKAYSKLLYSDMVSDIFDSYLKIKKPLKVEETIGFQNFVVPIWRPVEAINNFATRSVSAKHPSAGSSFVFYEDVKKFNFVTIESLFLQPVKEKYMIQPQNILAPDTISKELTNSVNAIENITYQEDFDILYKNLAKGMYASKLTTVNLLQRSFEELEFFYDKKFKDQKHLEKNKLTFADSELLNSIDSTVMLTTTTKGIENYGTQEFSFAKEDWMQMRTSQMLASLFQNRVTIIVPGNTERTAGEIVELAVLTPNSLQGYPDRKFELDPYQSGKYLIVAIQHILDKKRYMMRISLTKDTYVTKPKTIDFRPDYEPLMNADTTE